jgi:class 3 adenylate cyclase
MGEAALILGEWSAAEDWFRRAVEVAGKRFGDLHSPRRIARLLLTYLGGDRDRIEGCFRVPSVVVFAGHIVDVPGRSNPRFPAQLEPAVLESLRERLKSLNVGFGYSSVACGSDILFAESLLEAGSELHIVLPYEKEQFIKDSVEIVRAGNWGARCEAVLERATDVALASDQRLTGSTVQFEYSNLLLFGSAVARAEQLDTTLVPLAVWDGKPGDGPGGTAWTIENWRSKGLAVEIIRIDEILRSSCPNLLVHAAPPPRPVQIPSFPVLELTPAIRGLLFADAVGFSKLGEDEVARFVHYFLGLIGELAEKSPHAPILKNTWGDGLFFVFPNVKHAGVFALELREAVSGVDWKEKGLPEQAMRIGVHAGPVYSCMDPVTRQRNCIGAHVSRAARIEPITPPGHVYASQAFAALAAAAGVREFRCEYVGQTSLAKHYGTFPTYVVLRRTATAEALLRFPLRDLSSTEPTAI